MMSAISGQKRLKSFAQFDPSTHSWKTFQRCWLVNTFDAYLQTWPKKGSIQNGVCWEALTTGAISDGKRLWILASAPDSTMLEGMDIPEHQIPDPKESCRRQYTRAISAMLQQDDYSRIKTRSQCSGRWDGAT